MFLPLKFFIVISLDKNVGFKIARFFKHKDQHKTIFVHNCFLTHENKNSATSCDKNKIKNLE